MWLDVSIVRNTILLCSFLQIVSACGVAARGPLLNDTVQAAVSEIPEVISKPLSANTIVESPDAGKKSPLSKIPRIVAPPASLLPRDVQRPGSQNNKTETQGYTLVVDNVPVKDILFTLARDASLRMTVIGDIAGHITLSMIDQPLPVILSAISDAVPVRYQLLDGQIIVKEDKPFVRSYEVAYLNLRRSAHSEVELATQVGSMRTDIESGGGLSGSNGSSLQVENISENDLWGSLVYALSGLLGVSASPKANGTELTVDDASVIDPTGQSNGNQIFVNRESGVITVKARYTQHQLVEDLISKVISSAQRQVLIEATVLEVTLNDRFESGVDWKILGAADGALDYAQVLSGAPAASDAVTPVNALLSYSNISSILGDLSATVTLLRQFGEVQVLSSPRVVAMNNQPAVLKVVDNRVYFTFEVDRFRNEEGNESTTVDSTVHSVPVGLVMNVTPYISKQNEVILNVRPTLSRILNFAEDPSPALAGQTQVRNLIPEIQVREMESVLRVQSGNVAVIGGLMQNKVETQTSGVPGLHRVPWLGRVFSSETETLEKTELLVFIRPTVIENTINHFNDEEWLSHQLLEQPDRWIKERPE